MSLCKYFYALYNSTFYRVIMVGYLCVSAYGFATWVDLHDIVVSGGMLVCCVMYCFSLMNKSYLLMWLVLLCQIILGLYAAR